MLENNFSRSVQLFDGVSFLWERPMTGGLLVLAVFLVLLPTLKSIIGKRRDRKKFVADGD